MGKETRLAWFVITIIVVIIVLQTYSTITLAARFVDPSMGDIVPGIVVMRAKTHLVRRPGPSSFLLGTIVMAWRFIGS
jgi:hypothetical protein